MLFWYKLLFSLLGTSVVCGRDPAEPKPWKNPELVTLLPTSLRLFYRIPTQGVDKSFLDDIFEIDQDGTITFHQLSLEPGEELRTPRLPIFLTATNFARILGVWYPIPSFDVPVGVRFNQLTFYKSHRPIECIYHQFLPVEMLQSTSGTDGVVARPPPPDAKGTWNRVSSTHIHEDDCDDVVVLDDESDPKLYTLTKKPGQMSPQVIVKSVSVKRLVGLWRRMPAASVAIQQRQDLLQIEEVVDDLRYHVYHHLVPAPPPLPEAAAAA